MSVAWSFLTELLKFITSTDVGKNTKKKTQNTALISNELFCLYTVKVEWRQGNIFLRNDVYNSLPKTTRNPNKSHMFQGIDTTVQKQGLSASKTRPYQCMKELTVSEILHMQLCKKTRKPHNTVPHIRQQVKVKILKGLSHYTLRKESYRPWSWVAFTTGNSEVAIFPKKRMKKENNFAWFNTWQ
jgi:hypothetical protein